MTNVVPFGSRDTCPYCGHGYPRGREAAGPEIDAHLSECPGPEGPGFPYGAGLVGLDPALDKSEA